MSIQGQLRRSRSERFFGREQHIQRFRSNLVLPEDHPEKTFVTQVVGPAGVGKSFLVSQFDISLRNQGGKTALVADPSAHLLSMMRSIAAALETDRHFRDFESICATYLNAQNELQSLDETESAGTNLVSSFMAAAWTSGVLLAGDSIPPMQASILAERGSSLTTEAIRFVSSRLSDRVNYELLAQPVEHLGRALAAGLTSAAHERPLLIVFDNFERAGAHAETFLLDLLEGAYGELPPHIQFVVCSQRSLNPARWAQYADIKHDVALEPFSPEECEAFLEALGFSKHASDAIYALSDGLPLLVATLATRPNSDHQDLSSTGADAVVDRFLRDIASSDRRLMIAALCCRRISPATLGLITEVSDSDAFFSEIREQPFVVRDDQGLYCHPLLRKHVLRFYRSTDRAGYVRLHNELWSFFELSCQSASEAGTRGSQEAFDDYLSCLHHQICADGLTGANAVMAAVLEHLFSKRLPQIISLIRETATDLLDPDIETLSDRAQELSDAVASGPGPELDRLLVRFKPEVFPTTELELLWLERRMVALASTSPSNAARLAERAQVISERAPSMVLCARIHALNEEWQSAIDVLGRCLELDPGHYGAELLLGELLMVTKDYPEARLHLEAVRAASDQHQHRASECLTLLAISQDADPVEILGHVRVAILSRFTCQTCWELGEDTLAQLNEPREQLHAIQTLPVSTGDDRIIRARLFSTASLTTYALHELSLVGSNAESWRTSFERAWVYFRSDQQDLALDEARKALEQKPDAHDNTHWLIAQVFASQERYHDAVEHLELINEFDLDGKILTQIAKYLLDAGDADSALLRVNQAIEIDGTASRYALRSDTHERLGDAEGELADLITSLELEPSHFHRRQALLWCARDLGRRDLLEQNVSIDLDHVDAATSYQQLMLTATAHEFLGQFDPAIAMLERARQIDPTEFRSEQNDLGVLYNYSGRFDDSLAYYNVQIEASPADSVMIYNRAVASFFASGSEEMCIDAQIHFSAELELPESMIGYARASLEAMIGDIDLAVTMLETVIKIDPVARRWASFDPPWERARQASMFETLGSI